jgi:hypothetical protein
MNLPLIVTYGYYLQIVIISVAGIARYKTLNTAFKILTFANIGSIVISIASEILVMKNKTNAPVLHVEAFTDFAFYALAYYCLFNNQKIKKTIIVAVLVFVPFSVINALYLQPFNKIFPTYVNLPTLGLLAAFSLLLFKQMLLYPSKAPLLKQGVFWYNAAIIFYSTTMFLNIGLSNVFAHNPVSDLLVFYVWYIILYIFTILVGVAIVTDSKEANKTYAV